MAGFHLQYRLIPQKRKTIGIRVADSGEVIVTAPVGMSRSDIDVLVQRRAQWISDRVEEAARIRRQTQSRHWEAGESFAYLGHIYRLQVWVRDAPDGWQGNGIYDGNIAVLIPPGLSGAEQAGYIRKQLAQWYISQARGVLAERTTHFARLLGLYPNKIVLREQKTLWGSCSSLGNINYNWKLIFAPLPVMDYIVVHELCHMRHHNHGPGFWQMVGRWIPDFREKRAWLKTNGHTLELNVVPESGKTALPELCRRSDGSRRTGGNG